MGDDHLSASPGDAPTVPRSGDTDTLTVVVGTASPRVLTPDRTWTLGRAPECDLVVAGDSVSRRHLQFERTASGWLVRDVSANGTWCDGERVSGEAPVLPGANVRLALGARTGPELTLSRAAAPAPPPVAAPVAPPVAQSGPPPVQPPSSPPKKPRRRGRRVLISLVVLIAVLAVADRVAAALASPAAMSRIVKDSQGLVKDPDVSFGGFPFLTQVVFGDYTDIQVGIDDLKVPGGPRIAHVDAHLEGVHIPLSKAFDDTLSHVPIDDISATVSVAFADLNSFLAGEEGGWHLSGGGNGLRISGTVDGEKVAGSVELGVDGDDLEITPTSLQVGGDGLPGDLGDVLGDVIPAIPVPLPDLPFGIRLTDVHSDAKGLVAAATAHDVALDTGKS